MISVEKLHYKRNLLISLILSETIILLTFVLFPDFKSDGIETIVGEQIIMSDIIPPTRQNSSNVLQPKKPPILQIRDEIEAFELLEDVEILAVALSENNSVETNTEDIQQVYINTVPRLSLEVLPDNKDGQLNGRLSLSIKISESGKVIAHEVLLNSLDCEGCIDKVINAVYSSLWEPAVRNGANVEYWVQKSYIFN
ncbi:MAG: hypothetical protein PVF17_07045 [Ignavibacteria bacterium]|jgi:hypothetical protein